HNCARPRVRQLCSDAHAVTGVPDATYDEIIGAKLRRDFFLGGWTFLIARYGVPPNYAHCVEATECIDDLVSYALGEIILFVIARWVGKGKQGDEGLGGGGRRRGGLGASQNANWPTQRGDPCARSDESDSGYGPSRHHAQRSPPYRLGKRQGIGSGQH